MEKENTPVYADYLETGLLLPPNAPAGVPRLPVILLRDGKPARCPHKLQEYDVRGANIQMSAADAEKAVAPVCNSHCPLFQIKVDTNVNNVDKDGISIAKVHILCGVAPITYSVPVKMHLPADTSLKVVKG